ncbi:MAG: hypothetical protein ACXWLH_02240 [Candidatus Saccharimonadales bacterium]
MLYNKQKQFIKTIIVVLVFCLSLGIFNSGRIINPKVLAISCDPTKNACCQLATDPKAVELCKNSYIVPGNGENGNPEVGHCYTYKDGGIYGPLYIDADCTGAPFNISSTALKHQDAPVDCNGSDIKANAQVGSDQHCGILDYLVKAINVLSALVGLVVISVIIVSGIQFSAAGNDPQKVASARGHIVNAILALIVFIFMYAFLQWVVPGGIF